MALALVVLLADLVAGLASAASHGSLGVVPLVGVLGAVTGAGALLVARAAAAGSRWTYLASALGGAVAIVGAATVMALVVGGTDAQSAWAVGAAAALVLAAVSGLVAIGGAFLPVGVAGRG